MSGRSWLGALTGLVLIVGGCGQSLPSENSVSSLEESDTTVTFDGSEAEEVPLVQWDLAYSCADAYLAGGGEAPRLSVEELEQVFASHATQAQLDRIFQQGEFEPNPGPSTDWHFLGPDLLLATEALSLDEITFLAASSNPDYPSVELSACRLTRSSPSGEVLYSPAWHVVRPTASSDEQIEILVPDCGTENTASMEIDLVVVGEQLVITVRDPHFCDLAGQADLRAVSLEVPSAEGPLAIVDGAYWPWMAPVPKIEPTGVSLAQSTPSCVSQFEAHGITVSWSGVPGATEGQLAFDGVAAEGLSFLSSFAGSEEELNNAVNRRIEALHGEDPGEIPAADIGSGVLGTFGVDFSEATRASITLTQPGESVTIECEQIPPPVYSCSMVLVGGIPAAMITNQDGEMGAPIGTFYRDGVEIGLQGFQALDTSASPGGVYGYTVRLGMNPAGAAEIDCGTIEVPASVTGTEELIQAQTIYRAVALGPYRYVTFELICEGCPSNVWDGAGQHSTFGGEADWETVARDGQLAASEIPLAVYPDTVHQVLIDAIASGAEVDYTIDRASGVPVQWTIDGVGIRYLCVNIENRPPDMMPNGRCEEKYNVLGR